MNYAYVRVSTQDQCEDRQLAALTPHAIDEIFIDKASGKDFERPAYKRLISTIEKDDLLVIQSIDRLGRDYEEIQNQWRLLTKEKGVQIFVIDMPLLDTRKENDLLGSFVSDMVLQILSFVAESERTSIKKRQREGIQAAKARGVRFGRPLTPIPDNFDELVSRWQTRAISMPELLAELGVSKSTYYRMLSRRRAQNAALLHTNTDAANTPALSS